MKVILAKRASKALDKLDKSIQSRIVEGIRGLPAGDVKKLKGRAAAFRLRVGDYRILFEMTPGEIRVADILPRGDAYK